MLINAFSTRKQALHPRRNAGPSSSCLRCFKLESGSGRNTTRQKMVLELQFRNIKIKRNARPGLAIA
eukprot:1210884-Pyramimonas_sp.AAC.1